MTRCEFPAFLVARGLTRRMVEIGVDRAAFAELFLANWPGEYVGVDPYQGCMAWDRTPDLLCACHVLSRWPGRTRLLKWTTEEAIGYLRFHAPYDFVYIDGDHAQAAVAQDIAVLWPLVRSGGILAGHDFEAKSFPGVVAAVAAFQRIHGVAVDLTDEPYASWYVVHP